MPGAAAVYRAVARVAFTVMDLQAWRFDVTGLGHVPWRGGAVIAANHTSFWDFFTVGRPVYRCRGRPVRILAKRSLFELPGFGALMRRAGHIPVDRRAGGRALAAAVAAAGGGELILVLPGQTISPAFVPRGFKTGAVRIAARSGVPLVPAVSWGSHRFHTVGRWPRPRWRLPVSIRYGAPMHPDPDTEPVAATAALRARIEALLEQTVRDYPDGAPAGAWWVPARFGGGAPVPAVAEEQIRGVTRRFRHRAR